MARSFGRGRFMPDGSLVYVKKGFEPPPDVEGYQRDPGNAWRFLPLYADCQDRQRVPRLKRCGSYDVVMICTNGACPLNQQRVSVRDCRDCTHRRPAAEGS